MVHGIRIREGRAEWYRNRWVCGRPRLPGPRRTCHRPAFRALRWWAKHQRRRTRRPDPRPHRGWALVYELTDELDTVGLSDFAGTLPGGYTAHPKRDPGTGELHAVSYCVNRGNTVQYSIIDIDGRARRTVDIECPAPGDARLVDHRTARRHLRPAGRVRHPGWPRIWPHHARFCGPPDCCCRPWSAGKHSDPSPRGNRARRVGTGGSPTRGTRNTRPALG